MLAENVRCEESKESTAFDRARIWDTCCTFTTYGVYDKLMLMLMFMLMLPLIG